MGYIYQWSHYSISIHSIHVHPPTHPRTACFTAHVSKLEAATARRQRAAQEAELRGMGSLVAGSEHLVRVFFLDGSHRTVGFDRCVCFFGGGGGFVIADWKK